MDIRDELKSNIKTFFKSAELIYKTEDYTSACILYFKALFAVFDYIILVSGMEVPKDHTQRFRILEKMFPHLYAVLDKIFPVYRDTYSTSVEKIDCDEVKNYVTKLIKEHKIQE